MSAVETRASPRAIEFKTAEELDEWLRKSPTIVNLQIIYDPADQQWHALAIYQSDILTSATLLPGPNPIKH